MMSLVIPFGKLHRVTLGTGDKSDKDAWVPALRIGTHYLWRPGADNYDAEQEKLQQTVRDQQAWNGYNGKP